MCLVTDMCFDDHDSPSNDANFRTGAYEAIVSYVTQATPDVIAVVRHTALTVLGRMEQYLALHVSLIDQSSLHAYNVLQNQILGSDDRNNWNEVQSNLCGVVIVSVFAIFS